MMMDSSSPFNFDKELLQSLPPCFPVASLPRDICGEKQSDFASHRLILQHRIPFVSTINCFADTEQGPVIVGALSSDISNTTSFSFGVFNKENEYKPKWENHGDYIATVLLLVEEGLLVGTQSGYIHSYPFHSTGLAVKVGFSIREIKKVAPKRVAVLDLARVCIVDYELGGITDEFICEKLPVIDSCRQMISISEGSELLAHVYSAGKVILWDIKEDQMRPTSGSLSELRKNKRFHIQPKMCVSEPFGTGIQWLQFMGLLIFSLSRVDLSIMAISVNQQHEFQENYQTIDRINIYRGQQVLRVQRHGRSLYLLRQRCLEVYLVGKLYQLSVQSVLFFTHPDPVREFKVLHHSSNMLLLSARSISVMQMLAGQ